MQNPFRRRFTQTAAGAADDTAVDTAADIAADTADDAPAETAPDVVSLGVAAAGTFDAIDSTSPAWSHGLKTPQCRLTGGANALAIKHTGKPETVYVASLRDGDVPELVKCGVPSGTPGVVNVPAGADLVFARDGGGKVDAAAFKV